MSIEKVVMPRLGESIIEGTIVNWLVKPGDKIKKFDTLLEVETDKVVAEVPSVVDGIVKEILRQAGETVAVGSEICIIETSGLVTADSKVVEATVTDSTAKSSPVQESTRKNDRIDKGLSNNSTAMRYSPSVITLAQQHNISLDTVQGTGVQGRITRKDILAVLEQGGLEQAHNKVMTSTSVNDMVTSLPIDKGNIKATRVEAGQIIPLTAIRKKIAQKMVQSVSEIPHAWMMIEVDATRLVQLRNKIKNEFLAREGFPVSIFSFLIFEIVKALKLYPILNSQWQQDSILIHKDINISVAVAVEKDLFVPVIKNADSKNIKGIAKDMYTITRKAKEKKLTIEDMQGGTFTINNTGVFGSITSFGIINYPQAAILQVESIKKRPVVVDEGIAIRDMLNLCLSLDHRIIDGLEAGRFLNQVKKNIESVSIEE